MTSATTLQRHHGVRDSGRASLERYMSAISPFTPVLGLVRSAIAAAALLTLVLTPTDQLFFRSSTFPTGANCGNSTSWVSLFCIGSSSGHLEATKWVAVFVLAIVVTGLLPAITAIPHWWVTWSLMTSSTAVDGGEHLAANLALILVPLVLVDRRRWHWMPDRGFLGRSSWVAVIGYTCLGLWNLQMMGVYFQASVAKFSVLEWSDGTALWYWMQNPVFAPAGAVGELVRYALQWLPLTVIATYGTLALQLALVGAVIMPRRPRHVLLGLAVAFHLAIAVLMGLWSFSMIMIAADLLLLVRPNESENVSSALHLGPRTERKANHVSA